MIKYWILFFLVICISSCTKGNATRIESTPVGKFEQPTTTSTRVPFTSQSTKTATAENGFSIYRDKDFCLTVTYPSFWNQDGDPGAFADFTLYVDRGAFSIVNSYFGETPTLLLALDDLKRGSLGNSIISVEQTLVDQEKATWVTLNKEAEYKYVVLVITPVCGGSMHSLFITSTETDRNAFEDFVSHIKFNR